MRQYVRLIDFMLALGTAIQDYLPEDERANVPDLKSFLDEWTSRTSLIELYRVGSDIRSYLVKHTAGGYTVDEYSVTSSQPLEVSMRGFMELIDFMKHLAEGTLDYLPEDQRVGQLTADQVIEKWMKEKSYFAARSLRHDLKSYIRLYKSGDYSVDEILSWYDLSFIPERFGCEEWELFASILCSIDAHVERKRKDLLIKGFGWLGFR